MASKKSRRPARPVHRALSADTTTAERPDVGFMVTVGRSLDDIARTLEKIAGLLDILTKPPVAMVGGEPVFMAGGWHRRSGDVYASVAEPGSPNAAGATPPPPTEEP